MKVLYSCLISITICANLLLIIGIIKTKRNKLTSSQSLFSTLFLCDLTFVVVQLPVKIYFFWNSGAPTCLEVQVNTFSMTFPIIMSGTLLCVILIDRYINVVSNQYHKGIETKKWLPIPVVFTILIPLTCSTFEAFFKGRADFKRLANSYLVFFGYTAASLVVGVSFNLALLRNLKRQTNSRSNSRFNVDENNSYDHGCSLCTINDYSKYYCIWIYQFHRQTILWKKIEQFTDNFITFPRKCSA